MRDSGISYLLAQMTREASAKALAELREIQLEMFRSDIKETREIGIRLISIIERITKGLDV